SRYRSVSGGFNSRLDELQAAILRVKLRHLDAWNAARRERAKRYGEMLTGSAVSLPHEAAWATGNYHLYAVRAAFRDSLKNYLHKAGIGTQIHYPTPIHCQPAYANLNYIKGTFPCSELSCN